MEKNKRNALMNLYDKLLFCKRPVIETVDNELKKRMPIRHTGYCSVDDFVTNLLSGLIAY